MDKHQITGIFLFWYCKLLSRSIDICLLVGPASPKKLLSRSIDVCLLVGPPQVLKNCCQGQFGTPKSTKLTLHREDKMGERNQKLEQRNNN